ncbi:MAG: hypothetical protein JWQ12_2294 [Glaciihabitans sp.]|nr:hypothetical protein [Glaciihabitans sp.]
MTLAPAAPIDRHSPAIGTAFLIWLLLLASVVPWRQGVLYRGGIDPVVAAKAVLGVLALLLAATRRRDAPRPVGARSTAVVSTILAIGIIGAIAAGSVSADVVLTVRLFLTLATILFVIRTWPAAAVLNSLMAAVATIAAIAAVSGLPGAAGGGRLGGITPPLNPNEIALLAGLPFVALLHRLVSGPGSRGAAFIAAAILGGIVVATGSRTALVGIIVAALVILATRRTVRRSSAIVLLALVPVLYAVLTFTDLASQVISRGEAVGRIATLNSRTIAWDAVLSTPPGEWSRWWGTGLATTQVRVSGQYWDYQVLDSSWISVLAQFGVLGVVLLALWAVSTTVAAAHSQLRSGVALPLVVFILVRSTVESGLVDSSTTFVVFFTLAVLVEPATQRSRALRVQPEFESVPA